MMRYLAAVCAATLVLAGCATSTDVPQTSHTVSGGTYLPDNYRGTVLGDDQPMYDKGRYGYNDDMIYDGSLLPYTGTDDSIPDDDSVHHFMSDEAFGFDALSEPSLDSNYLLPVQGRPKLRTGSDFVDGPCADDYEELWLEEYETEVYGSVTQNVSQYRPSAKSPYPGDALFMLMPKRSSDEFRVDFQTSDVPEFFMFRFELAGKDVIAFQATRGPGISLDSRSFQGEWLKTLGVGPQMATAIFGVSVCAPL